MNHLLIIAIITGIFFIGSMLALSEFGVTFSEPPKLLIGLNLVTGFTAMLSFAIWLTRGEWLDWNKTKWCGIKDDCCTDENIKIVGKTCGQCQKCKRVFLPA